MNVGNVWQRRTRWRILRALTCWGSVLLLLACAAPAFTPAAPAAPAPYRVAVLLAGEGETAGGLNQLIWQGVTQAQQAAGFDVTAQRVASAPAGGEHLPTLTAAGYDLIVAAAETVTTADLRRFPQQTFVLVGADAGLPHVLSLTFDLTQPAFLAGYLAAGVSASGVVCTLAAEATAAHRATMAAFAAGVEQYNRQWEAEVLLLGWDGRGDQGAFVGSQDAAALSALVELLLGSGCDVLLPVGVADLRPTAAAVHARGRALIGGDVDGYLLAPEWGAAWLTSLQRHGDMMVLAAVQGLAAGQMHPGGVQVGTLANGGVGLAPLHQWEERTPAALRAELTLLQEALVQGHLEINPSP